MGTKETNKIEYAITEISANGVTTKSVYYSYRFVKGHISLAQKLNNKIISVIRTDLTSGETTDLTEKFI